MPKKNRYPTVEDLLEETLPRRFPTLRELKEMREEEVLERLGLRCPVR